MRGPRCSPVIRVDKYTKITPGMVLHNEDCSREWLILGGEMHAKYERKGVYPSLYFDEENNGRGVDAAILGQEVIDLHISTVGLVRKTK